MYNDDEYQSDFEKYLQERPAPLCDLKDCRINRSLTAALLVKEEQLKRERLKVLLQKGKRVAHKRKQEVAEDIVSFTLNYLKFSHA